MEELIKLLTGAGKTAGDVNEALDQSQEDRLAAQTFMAQQKAAGKVRIEEKVKKRKQKGLKKKSAVKVPAEPKRKPWYMMNIYDLFGSQTEKK